MSLTKDQVRDITKSMNEALQAVAKQHGLSSLKTNGGTFDPSGNFVIKVAGVVAGGLSADAKRYNDFSDGLPKLGTTFNSGQHAKSTIIGMTRSGKVLTERDGKRYKWDAEVVRRLCAKK